MELKPISIAIDPTIPPEVWGVFQDQYGGRSLWKRRLVGLDQEWRRVEGPQDVMDCREGATHPQS